jgi:Raf kinase inhibitor-like YbhB/YbcL family protein
MAFKLESTAFADQGFIPAKYTCDGANVSPPLAWSNVPEGAQSYAIIFDDPDAPAKTWVHWVLYNIPGNIQELGESIPSQKTLENGAMHGTNDFKNYGYGGPCPPGGTHGYHLKLYALDILLDIGPGATKQQLIDAMNGHILEKAELVGKYQRK